VMLKGIQLPMQHIQNHSSSKIWVESKNDVT